MGKDIWKPGTVIYPVPAVMVSCGDMENKNIITVAYTLKETGPTKKPPKTITENRYKSKIPICLKAKFLE